MRSTIANLAVAASLASFAAAQQGVQCPNKADSSKNPSGNAISTPGLHQNVPAGQPFDITWKPTTSGTVSILLLKGPATNLIGADCIASSVSNTGSFTWTFPSSLTASENEGYGIQIIVDKTHEYQYSDQFGISNSKKASSSSSESASKTSTGTESSSQAHKSSAEHVTKTDKSTTTTSCSTSTFASGTAAHIHLRPHNHNPLKGHPLQHNGTVHHQVLSTGSKTHSTVKVLQTADTSTAHVKVKQAKSTASGAASAVTSVVGAVATDATSSTASSPASSSSVVAKPANAGARIVTGGLSAFVGAFAALLL